MRPTPLRHLSGLVLAGATFVPGLSGQGENPPAPADPVVEPAAAWSNWRGPGNRAFAPEANPPTRWSETENIRYKIALPGSGSSSPIVWGDRIYLTAAVETRVEGKPEVPPPSGETRFAGPTPKRVHDFLVLALERDTGKTVWRRTCRSTVPHEGLHGTTTQAAHSPITDGERIYAFFGSRGLYCLDLSGKPLWSKQFGIMHTRREWGEGASPTLHGDMLVVNWDHEGEDFLVALDAATGEERWRQARDEPTTWSTPVVVEVEGRAQVIVAATHASRGYDLATGKPIWSCKGMTVNCIPTPVHADGVVYLMSGYRGQMLQAIRLTGAKGEITDTPRVLWRHLNSTSYVPSALLHEGLLYFLRGNSAVLTCLDARTGKVKYTGQRLRGQRSIYASPVGAGNRMYILGREGVTKVIALGPKFAELAENRLDGTFDATPAIVGDSLFLRSRSHLYRVAEKR